MARIGINTGSIANDGTGDTLRAAGGIINSNFLELYTYLGAGSTTTLSAPVWNTTNAGINTLRNVGIGTTNPRFTLEVGAVGASGTSLHVNGNARITGILTVGSSSVTIDGSLNKITVGSGITIDGSTGIISATAFYVGGSAISGSTGAGTTWAVTSVGIHTTKNVGIGTTNPTSALTVKGNTSLETLNVSGVSTFNGTVSFGTTAYFDADDEIVLNNKFKIYNNGSNTLLKNFDTNTGGDLYIQSDVILLQKYDGTETIARFTEGAGVELNYSGQTRLTTIDDGVIVGSNAAGVVHIPNELRIGTVAANQSNASIMIANSSGVGIGTTNPTGRLTVKGTSALENVTVSGVVTATSFVGDGSGLTGVIGNGSGVIVKSNGSLVGTAGTIDFGNNISVSPISAGIVTVSVSQLSNISVSGISTLGTVNVSSGVVTATSGIVTYYGDVSNAIDGRWTLGANGSSDYTFTGIGFTQTTNDPVLYLTRGKVYEFINNSGGSHPFQIRVGYSGAAYDTGVTNNGAASGTIRFEVPFNAPSTLYYQCTNHAGMGNQIYVLDQGNWVTTTVGIHTLSNVGIGITNPTSKLTVTGDGYVSGVVTATSFVGSGLNLTGVTTNFTAAGSNAVTRTFNTKLREFVSVKDYGATGDGSTDDTTYIQNAINSISANGGSIYFPQGTYKITSPLTVSNNTSIFGTGQTSKIQPGVGVTAILTYSATSNVTVEKLHFDGINTTNLTALYFPGGINNQFVHVSDCLFASMNRGIEMATDSFVVANNYAIDANTFFYGSDSSLNGSIHSNYILGGQYSVHLKQSGAQQAEGVRIFDNTFLNTSANALSVFVEAGLEIEIFDNIIDQVGSYGYSVYCSPAAGKSISSVKVLNNWCDSGNVGGSVYFYNCNQLIVDSNTFSSSSGIGTALTIKSGNQYSSTKNICLNAFSNVVDYTGSVNQYQTGNVYSPSVGAATTFERNIFENDLAVGLSTARGIILTSPNGTKYRLHVLNDGTLRTISVT